MPRDDITVLRRAAGLLWLSTLVSPGAAWGVEPPDLSAEEGVAVLLVPGCPTRPNGDLSHCLWFRAVWAAEIWHQGRADHLVVSGGAVYSPYVEALALEQALVRLGVPAAAISTETRARHTDENVAYSLAMIGHREGAFGVASHAPHARLACGLARSWGTACAVFPAPTAWAEEQVAANRHRLRADPVTSPGWTQHDESEHARRRDRRRGPMASGLLYLRYLTWGRVFRWAPPEAPGPEPTAAGAVTAEQP